MIRNVGAYSVSISYSSDALGKILLYADDECVSETVLETALQEKAASDESAKWFPKEKAANKLTEIHLTSLNGEHLIRIKVIEGSIKLGKIIIREE